MANIPLTERKAIEELAPTRLFKGKVFYFKGPAGGFTLGGLRRLLEKHGGKVAGEIKGNADVTHVILSGQIWGKQSTAGADPLVKLILDANEENRTESDDECNRTWLLDASWILDCLSKGKLISERKYDFDLRKEGEKATKQAKRKAQLDKERAANNGESAWGRGERVRWENEQRLKREEAEAAKLAAMELDAKAAEEFAGLDFLKKKKDGEQGKDVSTRLDDTEEESGDKTKGKGKEKKLSTFGFGRDDRKEKKEKKVDKYRKPLLDSDVSDGSSSLELSFKKASNSSKSQPRPSASTASSSKSGSKQIDTLELSDSSDVASSPPVKKFKKKGGSSKPVVRGYSSSEEDSKPAKKNLSSKSKNKRVEKERKRKHEVSSTAGSDSEEDELDSDEEDSDRSRSEPPHPRRKSKERSKATSAKSKGKGKGKAVDKKNKSEKRGSTSKSATVSKPGKGKKVDRFETMSSSSSDVEEPKKKSSKSKPISKTIKKAREGSFRYSDSDSD
ncbi:hypothetical protein JCM16303_004512 [Sporobolomyces ruberrimus]